MYDLINVRNGHVHTKSLYPVIAKFASIKLAIGQDHILVFNPDSENKRLAFEKDLALMRDDQFLMHLRARIPVFSFYLNRFHF